MNDKEDNPEEQINDRILYYAVQQNDLEKVKQLLSDTSIIISTKDKKKSFMHAISKQYDAISTYFIENSNKGFDIHMFDDYPFRISAEKGNLMMVEFLFKKGVNISNSDHHALKYSVYNGHPDIINFLINNGADIYKYCPVPVIAIAMREKQYSSLNFLLDQYIYDKVDFFNEAFLVNNINYDKEIKTYIEHYIESKKLNYQLENELIDNHSNKEKKTKI